MTEFFVLFCITMILFVVISMAALIIDYRSR